MHFTLKRREPRASLTSLISRSVRTARRAVRSSVDSSPRMLQIARRHDRRGTSKADKTTAGEARKVLEALLGRVRPRELSSQGDCSSQRGWRAVERGSLESRSQDREEVEREPKGPNIVAGDGPSVDDPACAVHVVLAVGQAELQD